MSILRSTTSISSNTMENLSRTREGPYILCQLAHLTSLMGRMIAKVILLAPPVRVTQNQGREEVEGTT